MTVAFDVNANGVDAEGAEEKQERTQREPTYDQGEAGGPSPEAK
jgi:hypothetical protein